MVEQGEAFVVQFAADADEVFFFAAAVFANQLFGNASVLGEYQQSDQESISRRPAGAKPKFVFFAERDTAVVAFPMVFGGNEFGGGFIAFFCLRADVADGFIQKDGYTRCLFFMGLFVEVDAVALGDFLTEYGGFGRLL